MALKGFTEFAAMPTQNRAESYTQGSSRTMSMYQRIENDLRRRVRQGFWSAGARLPSRQNLAREYAVDVSTVQKAIAGLLVDGTLRADNGRGTFVRHAGPETGEAETAEIVEAAGRAALTPAAPAAFSPALPSTAITVGILAEFGSRDYWQQIIIHALERSVGADNGSTRFFNLCPADAPAIPLRSGVEMALQEGVAALVVSSIHGMISMQTIGEAVRTAQAARVPIVFVSNSPLSHGVPHVCCDQEMLGFQAAEHLLQARMDRLLVLAPFLNDWAEGRVVGARHAVRAWGLPDSAIRVYPDEETRHSTRYVDNEETGYQLGQTMVEQENDLHAGGVVGVMAVNDKIARGFLRAASEADWRLGTDYLLIGFDDDVESQQIGLTTLHPPLAALGTEAGRLAMNAVRGGDQLSLQVRLRWHLVPRLSTVLQPNGPARLPSATELP